ncbi:hypothetical protein CJ030_MR3G014837 [Morella rubra]|uniref:S-protein homolog n=1 Tax=Morella rubra TaxID=262757 RepID=A0A6A1VYI3_9ROSI|nr:hypothetical protein CJ030_MR3G014837 [Morella rubra]
MKQTAASTRQLLCFVLLLLAALSLGNCKSLNSHGKYQVQIFNGLEDDILHAQCTAEGEELTNADLNPNQEHSWSFKKRDMCPLRISLTSVVEGAGGQFISVRVCEKVSPLKLAFRVEKAQKHPTLIAESRFTSHTQIWCYLLWTKGRRSFLSFLEDPTSMNEYSANAGCEWRAQKNGIFLLNKKTGAYEHRYDWDKKLDP